MLLAVWVPVMIAGGALLAWATARKSRSVREREKYSARLRVESSEPMTFGAWQEVFGDVVDPVRGLADADGVAYFSPDLIVGERSGTLVYEFRAAESGKLPRSWQVGPIRVRVLGVSAPGGAL